MPTGQVFELFADGDYRRGRVEVDGESRFYFVFSGERLRPSLLLLPGMQARSLDE
jgi:hypothetical protein